MEVRCILRGPMENLCQRHSERELKGAVNDDRVDAAEPRRRLVAFSFDFWDIYRLLTLLRPPFPFWPSPLSLPLALSAPPSLTAPLRPALLSCSGSRLSDKIATDTRTIPLSVDCCYSHSPTPRRRALTHPLPDYARSLVTGFGVVVIYRKVSLDYNNNNHRYPSPSRPHHLPSLAHHSLYNTALVY